MERRQNPPLHGDRPRGLANFTLIFALVVAVFGLVRQDPLLVAVGLAVVIFNWVTTPRQYLIYQDALVIAYGRPRVRVIPFGQIFGAPEVLKLIVGDRLRVRLVSGKQVIFQTRDLPTFHDRLSEALSGFRRDHPELGSPSPEPAPDRDRGPEGQGTP